MSYLQKYREFGIIGRGNFGSAHLVQSLQDSQQYVAKKIVLGGMSDKEIRGAHQEAELLRRLNHPNIVKYKESFCEEGLLIIVMEYCKIGDLGYHIKQKVKQRETFTETEIMNWFVQMCMALQYIHSQGILHRDIKSSNIYLTGNNTVKLGDFGISRVLQGSEAAQTVVGTPYYMSPEVCENKPYSYKSDTWSLGCVLYELCTLKHAFSADNLLGLVFKIVTERAEPIPSYYSPQLRSIVQNLLVKDSSQRISISELLRTPYVLSFMQNFVDTNGQSLTTVRSLSIRKTAVQVQEPPSPASPDETPKQRLARIKREKAEQEAEKLKQAAREAYMTNQITKQRKQDMLYSSPSQRQQNQAVIKQAMAPPRDLSGSGSTIASLMFTNQKSYERAEDLSELTEEFNLTRSQDLNTEENYRNYLKYAQPTEDTMTYSDTFEASAYTNVFGTKNNPHDDRPIRASGQYNLNFVDDGNPEIAENNPEELTQVISMYRNQMNNGGRLEFIEEASRESSSGLSPTKIVVDKRDSMRKQCVDCMGEKLFNEIYQFLRRQRQLETPDDIILEEVKKRWGRTATNYCFLVDQLIFVELF
ncbi:unnamed protein product [Blepharisma stoltei]|uniref:non-specific serine/threonine protein kinase n=1 Tax=Blepharisma stoltei TaxID=1481888 RepID=A0AAU9K3X3_9CILI|nr:unnamed protein product [Blepharisma stoltei]